MFCSPGASWEVNVVIEDFNLFKKFQAAAGPTKQKEAAKVEETSSAETSPGKENRLNQQKEEMLKKEMEAKEVKAKEVKAKEASKKRPNRGSDSNNKSKRRKRIQVRLLQQITGFKNVWLMNKV